MEEFLSVLKRKNVGNTSSNENMNDYSNSCINDQSSSYRSPALVKDKKNKLINRMYNYPLFSLNEDSTKSNKCKVLKSNDSTILIPPLLMNTVENSKINAIDRAMRLLDERDDTKVSNNVFAREDKVSQHNLKKNPLWTLSSTHPGHQIETEQRQISTNCDSSTENLSSLLKIRKNYSYIDLINNPLFSDADWFVGYDHYRISLHKIIVLIKSPKFCEVIVSNSNIVYQKNISKSAALSFLKYIYCEIYSLENDDDVKDVFILAKLYAVDRLANWCEQFLIEIEKKELEETHNLISTSYANNLNDKIEPSEFIYEEKLDQSPKLESNNNMFNFTSTPSVSKAILTSESFEKNVQQSNKGDCSYNHIITINDDCDMYECSNPPSIPRSLHEKDNRDFPAIVDGGLKESFKDENINVVQRSIYSNQESDKLLNHIESDLEHQYNIHSYNFYELSSPDIIRNVETNFEQMSYYSIDYLSENNIPRYCTPTADENLLINDNIYSKDNIDHGMDSLNNSKLLNISSKGSFSTKHKSCPVINREFQNITNSPNSILSHNIMATPLLREKLAKFGVRPLPKKKMIILLDEINNYTNKQTNKSTTSKITNKSYKDLVNNNNVVNNNDIQSQLPGISLMTNKQKDLLVYLIKKDTELYTRILMYEPLDFKRLYDETKIKIKKYFKETQGKEIHVDFFKMNKHSFEIFLDEQSVNFSVGNSDRKK